MPRVITERAMQGVSADRVWSIAKRLTDYPKFMDQVLSVEPYTDENAPDATSWVVLLNGNELRWIESDEYNEAEKRIAFAQTEGDLADWRGAFEVVVGLNEVTARYDVTFDLGIPALADVLHPLGEAAIRANCSQMLEEIEMRSQTETKAHAGI